MRSQLHMGGKERFSFDHDYQQHMAITGKTWPQGSMSDIYVQTMITLTHIHNSSFVRLITIIFSCDY